MKLKDANRDFDLQYAEVSTSAGWITSEDAYCDETELSVEDLVKRYPEAEGQISFSLEKGGFTFVGYNNKEE